MLEGEGGNDGKDVQGRGWIEYVCMLREGM